MRARLLLGSSSKRADVLRARERPLLLTQVELGEIKPRLRLTRAVLGLHRDVDEPTERRFVLWAHVKQRVEQRPRPPEVAPEEGELGGLPEFLGRHLAIAGAQVVRGEVLVARGRRFRLGLALGGFLDRLGLDHLLPRFRHQAVGGELVHDAPCRGLVRVFGRLRLFRGRVARRGGVGLRRGLRRRRDDDREPGGECGGALAQALCLRHLAAMLQPLRPPQELLPAPIGLVGAHRDLDVLLGEVDVFRRELEHLVDHVEGRLVLLTADRAFRKLQIVDLGVAVEAFLGVQVAQRPVNFEVLLGNPEDLLADRDRVLEKLRLGVLLDRLAIAADSLLHRAALGEEVGDQNEIVGVLVAAVEELVELLEGSVDLPLLDEQLRPLFDGEVSVHASP